MIFAVITLQTSLPDPPSASPIESAMSWIGDLLFGPLATAIAVIAIAWIGFAMLSGRVDIRRGLTVILGCFLLFGARGLADGLSSSISAEAAPVAAIVPPPPVYANPRATSQNTAPDNIGGNVFDPYAGASVPPTNR